MGNLLCGAVYVGLATTLCAAALSACASSSAGQTVTLSYYNEPDSSPATRIARSEQ